MKLAIDIATNIVEIIIILFIVVFCLKLANLFLSHRKVKALIPYIARISHKEAWDFLYS